MALTLPALLSGGLVAFTIEVDNEFEHRMPHTTAAAKARREPRRGPWLTSLVMWVNVLRHIDDGGTPRAEVHARARTTSDSLAGLQRWGYITVDDDVLRLTAAGRQAADVWRPLVGEVEGRWRQRFGAGPVDRLRAELAAVLAGVDLEMPGYLPILQPTTGGRTTPPPPRRTPVDSDAELLTLLAQVLLAFTVDVERDAPVALPLSADVLRVVGRKPRRVAELPSLSGVSKEAHAMSLGFLGRVGCVVVETDPTTGRGKVAALTPKGARAAAKVRRTVAATEVEWAADDLRAALTAIVGDDLDAERSALFTGLVPYPDGWRASVRPPATLPHHPMVLHRGGYPDGS